MLLEEEEEEVEVVVVVVLVCYWNWWWCWWWCYLLLLVLVVVVLLLLLLLLFGRETTKVGEWADTGFVGGRHGRRGAGGRRKVFEPHTAWYGEYTAHTE